MPHPVLVPSQPQTTPANTSTLLPRHPSVSHRRRIQIRPLPRPPAAPASIALSVSAKGLDGASSGASARKIRALGGGDGDGNQSTRGGSKRIGPRDADIPQIPQIPQIPHIPHPPVVPPRRSSSLSTRSTSTSAGHTSATSHTRASSLTSAPSSQAAAGTAHPARHASTASAKARAKARSILHDHRSPPHPPAHSSMPQPIPLMALLGEGSRRAGAGGVAAVTPTPQTSSFLLPPGHRRASPAPLDDPVDGPESLAESLAVCADPTISWSLQFWVTIADPLTHDVFFACPASGQCSWEPPVGAFVIPRSADGEWWELADASRDNQSYYYNTLTRVTQWQRPAGQAFVIPLGLIQRNALASTSPRSSSDSQGKRSPGNATVDSHTSSGSVRFAAHGSHDMRAAAVTGTAVTGMAMTAGTPATTSRGPLTPIADMSPVVDHPDHPDHLDHPDHHPDHHPPHDRQSWWERRRARSKLQASPTRGGGEVETSPVLGSGSPDGSPLLDDGTMSPSAVNLVLQPSSPSAATYQLENFSTDNFADRYFATKRSGVLRQRMSLERIMEWQRGPISSPLLVLSKASTQDAVTTFKVIQHVMGERERPVDGVRTPNTLPNPSVLSLRSMRDSQALDEKTVILEEIRWMIQLGVGRIEMRDELFCQLIKQLTRNPESDATVLGFQLFCVFVHAFGPSKSFEPFVRSFLIGNVERTSYGIGVMSKFCLTRLDTWMQKGGRGRVLSTAEIEHASDAAFYPSVYRQTLETIMQRQEGAYPELRIPIILPFLADGILALGGTESEGIFRVPGDNDVITHLKARIDHGQYQLHGIDDPHVVASLFKLWLRELEEPIIPTNMYDAALAAAKDRDLTLIFIKKLPDHNRRVLLFVVSFLQLFLDDAVVQVTKMTSRNLALVLAPNILRTPHEQLSAVFANAGLECQFVLNLLENLDPPSVDPEFVPLHGRRLSFESASGE